MARAVELMAGAAPVERPPRRSWLWSGGRRYFLLVYGLTILGLVAVLSASYPQAGRPTPSGGDPYQFFRRQLLFAGMGLACMLVLSRLRVRHLAWLTLWIGLPLSLIVMIYTAVAGIEVHDTRAWLLLGGVRFQPSEIGKVFYVFALAMVAARGPVGGRNWIRQLLPGLALVGAMVLILGCQRDLGMLVLFLSIALGVALLAGMKMRHWLPLVVAMVGLGLLLARSSASRWDRIEVWLNAREHLEQGGRHVLAMLIALARGGPVGVGLGMSEDKWRTLPVPHTDSIFCVIGGELGLWGGVAVIGLTALLGLWALDVARQCPHRLGAFVAAGAGLTLCLQGLLNIAVATASLPATGLTLPFLSAGGTSLVSSLALAGMVLAVAAESRPRPGSA